MIRIYPHIAGKTLQSHEKFLEKLTKKGAIVVELPEESQATIVFCPITSRFETDINAALDTLPTESKSQKVIMVAMHHTFDKDYILPNPRELDRSVSLLVNCLFYEDKGLFQCACNENAYKKVNKETDLPRELDRSVSLLVNCLFYEDKGLFQCACNENAYKKVNKELGLKDGFKFSGWRK